MKLILFLFVLLAISPILSKTHNRKKKCPDSTLQRPHNTLRKNRLMTHQLPLISSEGLPSTPKGITLKNHYGADPNDSPYGPRPTLVRKEVSTVYPDGSVHKENQTEIIHLPEGVFSDCDIASQKQYPLCFNLKNCDLCASNPHCGKKNKKIKDNVF